MFDDFGRHMPQGKIVGDIPASRTAGIPWALATWTSRPGRENLGVRVLGIVRQVIKDRWLAAMLDDVPFENLRNASCDLFIGFVDEDLSPLVGDF